jgi:hypothetical protein
MLKIAKDNLPENNELSSTTYEACKTHCVPFRVPIDRVAVTSE